MILWLYFIIIDLKLALEVYSSTNNPKEIIHSRYDAICFSPLYYKYNPFKSEIFQNTFNHIIIDIA